jgi:uncharacterized protein YjiK
MRTAIFITAFIVLSVLIAFTIRTTDVLEKKPVASIAQAIKNRGGLPYADVEIVERWDVPDVLKEISAIAYVDSNHFACVQDELGKIYVYSIRTGTVEKEIPFASAGDYEGLALVGSTAYVLSADGNITQVNNYFSSNPKATEHETHLTTKQDAEGLCFDKKNNRLLVAIKGKDPESDDYKGIYSFSLNTFKLSKEPVYKIDFNDEAFGKIKVKKKSQLVQPSDIDIHPKTGDIYITEGAKPKILVMTPDGKIKTVQRLKTRDFGQPEGISFSPDGKMYISNEGKGEPGNILELRGL